MSENEHNKDFQTSNRFSDLLTFRFQTFWITVQGALFTSEHIDENDILTIRHKCEVISDEDYLKRKLHLRTGDERLTYSAFYLAGNYDAARRKIKCVYV